MGNIFSKFFVSWGFGKKNKLLPAPIENKSQESFSNVAGIGFSEKPYKTLATFDLSIEKPKYVGAVPDATIKFYPLDK